MMKHQGQIIAALFVLVIALVGALQVQPPASRRPPASEAQQSLFNLKSLFNSSQRYGPPFSDRKCLMCKFSVSLINYALKTRRGYDQVDKLANNFCNIAHLESPLVCSQVSKLFNHEITKVLTYGIVTPNQVCGLLSNNTCGHFHSPLDEWEVNLMLSERVLERARQQQQQRAANESGAASNGTTNGTESAGGLERERQPAYRVIHISDTHVDLNYEPGSLVKCGEPLCCQKSSTPPDGSRVLADLSMSSEPLIAEDARAGLWGSYGHCDIPMRTFEAALKFIGSLLENAKDIEYIIWTGDIQPHDVWAQSKKTANQVFDAVFAKIFAHLPNVKILPTLGNHEMIPVDSFSPSNLIDVARDDSPVWLYRKLDSFWRRWLPADTAKTITKDGFYSTTVRKGLKVVSLNTNFCHTKNFWLFINSTDPGNQLQWLVHELQMSELMNERVHIIGHIPPGADDCMRVWSKNYNRIIRRFERTVTGQFFGHTHTSEFEMFYAPQDPVKVADGSTPMPKVLASHEQARQPLSENQKKQQVISTLSSLNSTLSSNGYNLTKAMLDTAEAKRAGAPPVTVAKLRPIKVGFIGPSITTFIGLNPSFRIYNVDPERDYMPTDFETYYMNLTQANSNTNSSQEPQWTSAGLFTETFNISDTSPESMHSLLIDIAADLNLEGDEEDADVPGDDANDSEEGYDGDGDKDDGDDESGVDDKLFELYRLFNSYSDEFSRETYEKISAEEKRKFLCRMFTGQAHNLDACTEFIPVITVVTVANTTLTV